jgi:hypothetical protein
MSSAEIGINIKTTIKIGGKNIVGRYILMLVLLKHKCGNKVNQVFRVISGKKLFGVHVQSITIS